MLDADMINAIDERINKRLTDSGLSSLTAIGTITSRTSATNGYAVFDGSQGPVPIKISGTAPAYEGDRVYLTRYGRWWTSVGTAPARGTEQLISEIIVSGTVNTISFTGIPLVYNDLKLIGSMRSDAAATQAVDMRLRCNGDTGARYSYLTLDVRETQAGGAPSVSTAAAQTGFDWAATIPAATTFSETRAGIEITLFDYTNTSFAAKEMRSISGFADVGSLQHMHFRWGAWDPTAAQAITSIELATSSGNYVPGSQISLWGIG
jgi:hypothetical protein